eukprot:5919253-Amphidinium_carterae.1
MRQRARTSPFPAGVDERGGARELEAASAACTLEPGRPEVLAWLVDSGLLERALARASSTCRSGP